MKCTHCGAELENDGLFCTGCGRGVRETSASTVIEPEEAVPAATVDSTLAPAISGPIGRSGRALSAAAGMNGQSSHAVEDLSGRALATEPEGSGKGHSGAPALPTDRRLSPQAIHALLTQANLDRLRGQFYEATERCVTVLRSQPGSQTAHALLGDIYRDQGKLDDAIQWYRLSLDLNPNPADRAKLAQAERERIRLQAAPAQIGRRGSPGALAPDPLDAASGLQAGTTPLLGQSPRFWLSGLWAASLAFLIVVLVLLSLIHPAHKSQTARKGGGFSASPSQLPQSFPPLNLPHGTDAANSAPQFTRPAVSPPAFDRLASPAKPLMPLLPTAPVVDVKPLTSGAPVHPPLDTPPPSYRGVQDDMRVDQTWDAGNGEIAIVVTAPTSYATDAGEPAREKLIRNVFRAAQMALYNSAASVHARVFVQVQSESGPVAILQAELDRDPALAANAETDAVNTLQSHLRSLKWPGGGLPGSSPSSSGDTIR